MGQKHSHEKNNGGKQQQMNKEEEKKKKISNYHRNQHYADSQGNFFAHMENDFSIENDYDTEVAKLQPSAERRCLQTRRFNRD